MPASERAEKRELFFPSDRSICNGDKKMKLWILGLASALFVISPQAKASLLLDWSTVPPSQRQLEEVGPKSPNGLYTTGTDFSGVDVTVQGSGFAHEGLHDPKVDPKGHPYSAPVLSAVADFKPAVQGTSASVTFTIDFFGFKQGVKDVSFELFNIDSDHSAQKRLEDVVTFQTAGLSLIGGKDVLVSGNTVTGIHSSGAASTDEPGGDVAVKSGGMPLHQIVFNWTEIVLPGTKNFLEEIAIGNISFTPVPEVGQLVIGLVACLLGALWLHKNRRKRPHSIP
jgi:hypothetical protein